MRMLWWQRNKARDIIAEFELWDKATQRVIFGYCANLETEEIDAIIQRVRAMDYKTIGFLEAFRQAADDERKYRDWLATPH